MTFIEAFLQCFANTDLLVSNLLEKFHEREEND